MSEPSCSAVSEPASKGQSRCQSRRCQRQEKASRDAKHLYRGRVRWHDCRARTRRDGTSERACVRRCRRGEIAAMPTCSTRSSRTERRLALSSSRQLSDRCTTKKEILRMLMHFKRTRSHRNGERARVERRCSGKITAIDDQIEPGRLVLLVRWGSSSAVALRRRTADGGRASDQLAWGDRARDTAVADVDLADVRSLPGQRKPNSFLSRTVHQVAVICRFALLGGTTQKTRGGARISERKKGRPFGRTFRHCSRARNHRGAVRRARSLRAGKQAELRPKCRIREFGGFRVLVSWPPPPSTARLLDGRPVFRCWWALANSERRGRVCD